MINSMRRRVRAHPKYPTLLLVNCLVGMFSTTFPATILTVSVKLMAEELDSAPSTIVWVTTAPILAAAVAMPVLGRLGDIRGHRRLYLTGFAVAITFSFLTAIAWNAASLIAFRTIAQLGGTATVPASLAMVFRSFPPEQRVRASAWSSATLAGAAVSGVLIGGPLVDSLGWRPIFVLQGFLALLAFLPAFVVLPDDEERARISVDVPGAVTLAVAAFTLTFGINRLAVWGFHPLVVAMLLIAPVATALLFRVERRAASPILPLHLVANRNVRVVVGASFALGASWMSSFILTPLLLQSVMGYGAGVTSLVSAPRASFIALSSPVASRLGMRYGERRLMTVAAVGVALTMGVLAVGAATTTIAVIVVALATGGWAFGHVQPGLMATIGNAVDEDDFGVATSLQQTSNQIGSVLGLGLTTAIAADATTPGRFVVAYIIGGALALVAAAICWRADETDAVLTHITTGEDVIEEGVPVVHEQLVHRPAAVSAPQPVAAVES